MSMLELIDEMSVNKLPATVGIKGNVMNPFHKCLWILRHKFNCNRSPFLKTDHFNSVQQAYTNLNKLSFPVLLSVVGLNCTFNHVIAIWNKMIIEFESKRTICLTLESFKYICGKENEFLRIDHGCGIFLSKDIKKKNGSLVDWGENQVNVKGSDVYHLFEHKK